MGELYKNRQNFGLLTFFLESERADLWNMFSCFVGQASLVAASAV